VIGGERDGVIAESHSGGTDRQTHEIRVTLRQAGDSMYSGVKNLLFEDDLGSGE
jgi:hypothetical protein